MAYFTERYLGKDCNYDGVIAKDALDRNKSDPKRD